jgi:ribosomal protein L40E
MQCNNKFHKERFTRDKSPVMASKICPYCGAKNPSDTYSCSNCAASLVEIPSATFPSSTPTQYGTPSSTSSSPWTSVSQQNQNSSTPPSVQEKYDQESTTTTTTMPNSTSTVSTGEIPVAVVSQSPWMNIANSGVWILFILIFGLGAGVGSFGLLGEITYVAAVIAVPTLVGYLLRPKYAFYETHLARQARGGKQEIPYSEIQSVDQRRGNILLYLKQQQASPSAGRMFRNSRIAIPGNPKLSNGGDLATWLRTRITPVTQKGAGDSGDTKEQGM